jgi:hypothetical protein
MRRILMYLVLALIVLGVGFYLYQRNIAPIPVSAADLEKGGAFSDAEKSALAAACAATIKKDTDKVCGCITDKAASGLSRFERMMATASFQGKVSDLVGITKGLIDSGIPADKVKAAESDAKTRFTDLTKTCGVTQ